MAGCDLKLVIKIQLDFKTVRFFTNSNREMFFLLGPSTVRSKVRVSNGTADLQSERCRSSWPYSLYIPAAPDCFSTTTRLSQNLCLLFCISRISSELDCRFTSTINIYIELLSQNNRIWNTDMWNEYICEQTGLLLVNGIQWLPGLLTSSGQTRVCYHCTERECVCVCVFTTLTRIKSVLSPSL